MRTITWKVIFDDAEFGGEEPLDHQIWLTDEELEAAEPSEEDLSLYSAEYRVYVIRDGAGTPIYVGQSRNAIERLQNHLALLHRSAKPSEVGAYVLRYLPFSLEWQIDLYTREECLSATRRQVGRAVDGNQKKSVDDFERHLIWEFSPWFNRTEPQKARDPIMPAPSPW